MINLTILRWGDYPRLSEWTQYNHMGPQKQRTFPGCGQRDISSMESMDVGALSQGMLVVSGSEKGKGMDSSRKECSPADTLILAQGDPCWTSNLKNCEIINLCCIKATK